MKQVYKCNIWNKWQIIFFEHGKLVWAKWESSYFILSFRCQDIHLGLLVKVDKRFVTFQVVRIWVQICMLISVHTFMLVCVHTCIHAHIYVELHIDAFKCMNVVCQLAYCTMHMCWYEQKKVLHVSHETWEAEMMMK